MGIPIFKQFVWHIFFARLVSLGVWCSLIYFIFYCLEKFKLLNWLFSL